MLGEVTITRTYEDTEPNDGGKFVPVVRVEFKVGTDGPFTLNFAKDGFSGITAKQRLDDFARELRSVRG